MGQGSFRLGSPSADLMPLGQLVEASRQLLQTDSPSCLTYGEIQGNAGLRARLLELFSDYYRGYRPENVLLTYGITEAISLVARTFLKPGDVVAVESPTYYWALPEFTSQGARCIQIPTDEEGMTVDLLEEHFERTEQDGGRIRLIYCMPTFHNPGGFTMPLDRRLKLLKLAERFDALVLEDDPYFLLRYRGADLPPLASLDESGLVIHSSTFSKVIGPGVRMGWILTRSRDLMKSLLELKPNGTNPFVAAILENYLRNGFFDSHVKRARQFYGESCEICQEEAARLENLGIAGARPSGGFYYWLELPRHWSARAFAQHCVDRGLDVFCGDSFFAEVPTGPCIRLAFSSFGHEELRARMRQLSSLAAEFAESMATRETIPVEGG